MSQPLPITLGSNFSNTGFIPRRKGFSNMVKIVVNFLNFKQLVSILNGTLGLPVIFYIEFGKNKKLMGIIHMTFIYQII